MMDIGNGCLSWNSPVVQYYTKYLFTEDQYKLEAIVVVSESLKQTSSDKITTCSLCLGFDFLSALAAIKTCLQTARLCAGVFFDVSYYTKLACFD